MLKTIGYVVSSLSVVLLAVVSWKSAVEDPSLMLPLLAGVATSILGMLLRWISFARKEKGLKGDRGTPVRPPRPASGRR
jgi:hypothetical protein